MKHTERPTADAPYRDATRPVDERVRDLLARMSFDEKAAQMHALWLRLSDDGEHRPRPGEVIAGSERPGYFAERLLHGLGQITRPLGTASVEPAAGLRALNRLQRFLRDETRLGIPAISHEECLLGLMARGATLFPSALAYGATWNPALIERVGEQVGLEARALGCQQGLAPVLDVSRDLRWGRTEETFGEDPYLVGVLGTRYVRGLQGPRRDLLATLKHFAAHSASEGGRNHAPVSLGWRELNDVFLLPFEMVVKQAHAGSVMPAYHDIDGEPAHASRHLLTEVLREHWGFDGLIVADYGGTALLRKHHATAVDDAQAAAQAFNAGLDIELPDDECTRHLAQAVERGDLDLVQVDRIVARVLGEKFRLGLFERSFDDAGEPLLHQPVARAVALEVARESIVLLENRNSVLPLAPGQRIAVIGPTADDPLALLGGYSFPVHLIQQEAAGSAAAVVTPLAALRALHGEQHVSFASGCLIFEQRGGVAPVFPGDALPVPVSGLSQRLDLIPAAVAAAQAADVAVVFVGDLPGLFQSGTVGEGSDTDSLTLPGVQQQLLQAVVDSGTPTVVVLSGGRPYALGGLEDRLAGFLMSFCGGEAGGTALAELLCGQAEPSGRLTVSVPLSVGALPCVYNHKLKSAGSPVARHFGARYPFGHGLGYTRFAYRRVQLGAASLPLDGAHGADVVVSFELANVGDRHGVEVAQLYVRDRQASVVRPVRELKAFQRVELAAGAVAEITFSLPVDMLNLTDMSGRRVVEPGWFDLFIGGSSRDTPLQAAIELAGDTARVLPRHWRMESRTSIRLL